MGFYESLMVISISTRLQFWIFGLSIGFFGYLYYNKKSHFLHLQKTLLNLQKMSA